MGNIVPQVLLCCALVDGPNKRRPSNRSVIAGVVCGAGACLHWLDKVVGRQFNGFNFITLYTTNYVLVARE